MNYRRFIAGMGAILMASSAFPALAQTLAQPADNPSQAAPAPQTGSLDEQARALNARYPVGIYMPNPADPGMITPPRFYYAADMLKGVQLTEGGPVVRFTPEQIEGQAHVSIEACNAGDRWFARIGTLEERRQVLAAESDVRFHKGNRDSDRAHVAGAIVKPLLGFALGGPIYAGIIGMGELVGLVDHGVNKADRKTFHDEIMFTSEVQGLDLEMRRGWVETMVGGTIAPGGWCGAFRNWELHFGNKAAAAPQIERPAPVKPNNHRQHD
ncbi:MAG: hypothetical protein JWL75_303 [Parcubacteria group bacterium]|nr:hypothetical protein [Parcubacteria group bacterium]